MRALFLLLIAAAAAATAADRGVSAEHPRIRLTASSVASYRALASGNSAFSSDLAALKRTIDQQFVGRQSPIHITNTTADVALNYWTGMAFLCSIDPITYADYCDYAIDAAAADGPFAISNGGLLGVSVNATGKGTASTSSKHFLSVGEAFALQGCSVGAFNTRPANLAPIGITVSGGNPTRIHYPGHGLSAGEGVYLYAGSGPWAAKAGVYAATVTGPDDFTVGLDSTSLGTFPGNGSVTLHGYVVSAAPTPTTLEFTAFGLAGQTCQNPGAKLSYLKNNGSSWPVWQVTPTDIILDDAQDTTAYYAEAAAYVHDWCHARIVERGLDAQVVGSLKNAYKVLALNTNATGATAFNSGIRESVFHNYSTEWWTALLTLGLSVYGEDNGVSPSAEAMVDFGWGILSEGVAFTPAALANPESYQFNLLDTTKKLTGGAMNFEGPGYWRNAAPEIIRGVEAFDVATGRSQDVWKTTWSAAVNAGWYLIYAQQPNGRLTSHGDSDPDGGLTSRENYGMVVLMDRFADEDAGRYFKRFLTQNGWSSPEAAVYKLMYWDYANRIAAAADYTALPMSRQFGNEIFLRSGWSPNDTYVAIKAGWMGAYHGGFEQGSFNLFRGRNLIMPGGTYAVSFGDYYYQYWRRSYAKNVPLIYQPDECWMDGVNQCTEVNDGGQMITTLRRVDPPLNSNEWQLSRLWDASILTDPAQSASKYAEKFNGIGVRFNTDAAWDYVYADLTKAYTNSNSAPITCVAPGANASAPCANHNTNARVEKAEREFVFQRRPGSPGYLVVADRIRAASGAFQQTIPFHFLASPEVRVNGSWDRAGTAQQAQAVTGASASPAGQVRLTVPSHSWAADNSVVCSGITGVPGANTSTYIDVIDANTIELRNTAFSGAYGGGGTCQRMTGGIRDFAGSSAWRTDNGDSRLFVTTVLPQNSIRLRALGGNNCPGAYQTSCGFEGVSYTNPADPAGSATNHYTPTVVQQSSARSSPVAAWRMEVQPTDGSAGHLFVHVLYPSDAATAAPPTSTAISGSNASGVLVDDPAGGATATVFTADGSPASALTYEIAATGTVQHVVCGLAPGWYEVKQNGTSTQPVVTNNSGAIGFTAEGGGSFSIQQVRGGRGVQLGGARCSGCTIR